MADVTDLQKLVEYHRASLMKSIDDNPRVAAAAAYDAVTSLLIEVVNELRDTRLRGDQRNA